mmetsp:Transcript_34779/g.64434  ORF Transcript_34779/g.64434 Transcript_34779/m.64434 type:complete len:179 (-) Transcript_34779:59-595(-)
MGVDVVALVDLCDFIFQDEMYLDFRHFMDLVMQLRGSNQATVKDIVDLRRFITMEFNALLHALELIPHDTELYTEVSKTITGCKSVPLDSLMRSQTLARQNPPAVSNSSSKEELGILEPLDVSAEGVENGDKQSNAYSEGAAENGRITKKKLRRKTTNNQLQASSSKEGGPFATLWES